MTNGTQPEDEDIDTAVDVMTWRHSTAGQIYTLNSLPYRCLVWQTEAGPWAAVVTGDGQSVANYNFSAPEEAKAWCEAHVISSTDSPPSIEADPAPQRWRYRAPDRNYSLGHGNIHCRVWYTKTDTWRAVVSQPGSAKPTQNTFDTLEEAQAWCERLMAERKAGK